MVFQLALELLRLHLPTFEAARMGEEISETLMKLSTFFNNLSPDSSANQPSNSPDAKLVSILLRPIPANATAQPRITVEQLLKSAKVNFGEAVTNMRIETLRLACRLRVIHALSATCVREAIRTLQPQLAANPADLSAICFSYKVRIDSIDGAS